jgi:hypothetical protein
MDNQIFVQVLNVCERQGRHPWESERLLEVHSMQILEMLNIMRVIQLVKLLLVALLALR